MEQPAPELIIILKEISGSLYAIYIILLVGLVLSCCKGGKLQAFREINISLHDITRKISNNTDKLDGIRMELMHSSVPHVLRDIHKELQKQTKPIAQLPPV